jgi:hypothetical protein
MCFVSMVWFVLMVGLGEGRVGREGESACNGQRTDGQKICSH